MLILTSCISSAPTSNKTFTESQALYALQTAAIVSTENALDTLKKEVEKTSSFLPPDYQFLNDYTDLIPGLEMSIQDFSSYVSTFFSERYSLFEEAVLTYVADISFENPINFVESSNTSITEYFKKEHINELTTFLTDLFNSADQSVFDQIINQFNRWVKIQSFMGKSPTVSKNKKSSDVYTWIANTLSSEFISILASCEEYYRTTPQAYNDSLAAYVFGIE